MTSIISEVMEIRRLAEEWRGKRDDDGKWLEFIHSISCTSAQRKTYKNIGLGLDAIGIDQYCILDPGNEPFAIIKTEIPAPAGLREAFVRFIDLWLLRGGGTIKWDASENERHSAMERHLRNVRALCEASLLSVASIQEICDRLYGVGVCLVTHQPPWDITVNIQNAWIPAGTDPAEIARCLEIVLRSSGNRHAGALITVIPAGSAA